MILEKVLIEDGKPVVFYKQKDSTIFDVNGITLDGGKKSVCIYDNYEGQLVGIAKNAVIEKGCLYMDVELNEKLDVVKDGYLMFPENFRILPKYSIRAKEKAGIVTSSVLLDLGVCPGDAIKEVEPIKKYLK